MDVHSVIERVMQTYAGARLYSDRGTVVFGLPGGERLTVEFETAFERPARFAFSFSVSSSVAGGAGRVMYTRRVHLDGMLLRMGDPEWRGGRPESLDTAIASSAGISFGSAQRIPHLLMPERITGRGLFEWPERTLGDPVEIDGLRHLVIDVGRSERTSRVFVDEASLVVRRVVDTTARTVTTDYFAVLTPGRRSARR